MKKLIVYLLVLFFSSSALAWDFSSSSIPTDEIMSGGPPKDGIPALINPDYLPAEKASYLKKSDQVIGVSVNGDTRAYPLKIMSWHELVNDTIGGQPILVSWWPLAYTGAVFVREIDGKELTFGVSGQLYRSNLLMYDHQTESLWLQVRRRAVTGPMTGAKLKKLPSTITSWEKWLKKYPETKVLSYKTAHMRDYTNDPYEDYYQSREGLFSFLKPGPGAEEKELIIGVEVEGKATAYRLATVRGRGEITDSISGRDIRVRYDKETDRVAVTDADGTDVEYISTYWMVWKAIYPETGLYGR